MPIGDPSRDRHAVIRARQALVPFRISHVVARSIVLGTMHQPNA
jgi:hypothetical protein